MGARGKDAAAKYYDGLIASVMSYFILIVSLTIAYAILAISQYERNKALSFLPVLEEFLAIRNIALHDDLSSRTLTKRDLLQFFPAAKEKVVGAETTEDIDKLGFTENGIANGRVVTIAAKFGHRPCAASVIRLSPGVKFNFLTFEVVGKTYWANSEETKLIVFDNCFMQSNHALQFMVLRSNSDIIIAFPKAMQALFPGLTPPKPFTTPEFFDSEKLSALVPAEMKDFGDWAQPMVMMHLDAINYFILRYASKRHGRSYSLDEFDSAVARLSDEHEQSASLLGINANFSLLISCGPVLLLVLSFEMWRRTRRIPLSLVDSSTFWFATDTGDFLGRLTARIYACVPAVCVFVMGIAFYFATGASFVEIDKLKKFIDLMLQGDSILTAAEFSGINITSTLMTLLIPFQLYVIYRIVTHFFAVIKANEDSDASTKLTKV